MARPNTTLVPTLGGVAVLAVSMLVGCSDTPASHSVGTTVTRSASATFSTPPPPRPVTVTNSATGGRESLAVRRGVLAWGCNGAPFAKKHPERVQVELPTETVRHDIPIPTSGNERPADTQCATMNSGSTSIVVIVGVVHKKSSGLDTESYELTLFSYDLDSTSPLATKILVTDRQPMRLTGIAGTAGGVAVSYTMHNNVYKSETQYFTGPQLTPTWKAEGNVVAATDEMIAVEIPDSRGGTPRFSVHATSDGGQLDIGLSNRPDVIVRSTSFLSSSDEGFAFTWHGVNSTNSNHVVDGIVWDDGNDVDKQRNALDEATNFQPDPLSKLALVTYSDGGEPAYKVVDRTTWETKLEIDAAKAKGINLSAVGIADEKLYILNGNDSPVIEITTGKSVHSGWTSFPVAKLGAVTVVATESDHGLNAGCVDPAFGRGDTKLAVYNCPTFTLVPDVDGKFPGPSY